jgi:N6-L-threonylcarbamoyladenine synthase
MLFLGIETSCDETAAAVVEDGRQVLSSIVASQDTLHLPYGGVVPEIACRAHLTAVLPVIRRALEEAQVRLEELDGVAVTHTPGLIGALLIGVTAAKTLAWLRDLPIIGVNHLHAHAYAAALEREAPLFPCVSLVASGGHTSLFLSRSAIEHETLGATLDDAAGEAFDKAASILGLGYPGGPSIDRAARAGDPRAIAFPRTRLGPDSLDFSFSGIKTAVLYHCRGQNPRAPRPPPTGQEIADVAASFQEAVVDTLVEKLLEAARRAGASRIAVGGGVAANSRLRERLADAARRRGLEVVLPPIRYCMDNAAMVAGIAHPLYAAGRASDLTLDACPTERRDKKMNVER